jgi:aerobic-type carbon monoxide dehydrogenase small subunit (CoxS/CutS family)
MASFELKVNGARREVEADPDTPLLWILRDHLDLTGTKYGCGMGVCGACAVHVDGRVRRSCTLPVEAVGASEVRTIEALGPEHPAQRAWIEAQVPQCGYCQSGQIMTAAALLDENPDPSEDDIEAAMAGVLCRCGTYPRIRAALRGARRERG